MELYGAITLAVLVLTSSCSCQTLENTSLNPVVKCDSIKSNFFGNLDIQNLLGKWEVKELHLHEGKGDPNLHGYKGDHFNVFTECPTATIWDQEKIPTTAIGHSLNKLVNTSNDTRLILAWSESGAVAEYVISFKYVSPGNWSTDLRMNGILLHPWINTKFSNGVVQVVNASRNYLVLNFCNGNDLTLQFSAVLFHKRVQSNRPSELASVHTYLQNMKLISSTRLICKNSATKALFSMSSIIVVFLHFVRS